LKVKNILVSQPPPVDLEKSPYTKLAEKYKLNVDHFKFIKIEGIPSKEFRKSRVNLLDYTAVIFTSRQAVDNYFRLAKEVRAEIPEDMKYFCISESTAYYLQNYVQFRKRKIFHGKQSFADLMDVIRKHKEDKYLFPCSDNNKYEIPEVLDQEGIQYHTAVMYRTLSCDLKQIDIYKYDMFVFFSPSGVKSLFENYPDFKQGEMAIAAFGSTTAEEVVNLGLELNVMAPTPEFPSMTMAIENFVKELNKRKR
jgi:uroporphyrinogen-III synthase